MIENNDKKVIELLRDKTDETDFNNVLKKSFGGYTKQSVQEYMAIVRKQQQQTKETFSRNLQTLFEEKETMRNNYETLLARHNKLAVEYDNLAESLKHIQVDDAVSIKDVMSLKSNIVSLEEEVKVTKREKQSLEREIDHLNNEISNLTKKLEHSKQETEAHKEMLKAERAETKKQRDMVADISKQLEDEKREVKYLKSTVAEGKLAELNSKVDELTAQLMTQTNVIKQLNAQIDLKDKTINTLNDEIAVLKQKFGNVVESLKNANLQNDKLIIANELLRTQLEEEYKKTIGLINEKADVVMDRLIAQKKLSEAESKKASLELQLEKLANTEAFKNAIRSSKEFEMIENEDNEAGTVKA